MAVYRSTTDDVNSDFVYDVIFLHYEANKSQSKTTCMFRQVRQVAAPEAKIKSYKSLLNLTAFGHGSAL